MCPFQFTPTKSVLGFQNTVAAAWKTGGPNLLNSTHFHIFWRGCEKHGVVSIFKANVCHRFTCFPKLLPRSKSCQNTKNYSERECREIADNYDGVFVVDYYITKYCKIIMNLIYGFYVEKLAELEWLRP